MVQSQMTLGGAGKAVGAVERCVVCGHSARKHDLQTLVTHFLIWKPVSLLWGGKQRLPPLHIFPHTLSASHLVDAQPLMMCALWHRIKPKDVRLKSAQLVLKLSCVLLTLTFYTLTHSHCLMRLFIFTVLRGRIAYSPCAFVPFVHHTASEPTTKAMAMRGALEAVLI